MNKIRVMIVEDDKDWLRGLSAILTNEEDMKVVAAAETREQALRAIHEQTIDVVLMDIMLAEGMEGIRLTEEVIAGCGAQVIMLTSLEEKNTIFEAFQAGAIDYQIKSRFERIPQAVREAYRQKSPIHADIAEQMREEFRRLRKIEQEYKVKQVRDLITPAELEVLEMIQAGHTQSEIANQFVVSIHTVKNHVNHILKKLGVKSSKEAVQKVKDAGIFDSTTKS